MWIFPKNEVNTRPGWQRNLGPKSKCITTSGDDAGRPCIFPWYLNDAPELYQGCSLVNSDQEWCPTELTNGSYISGSGKWGYCDMSKCIKNEGSVPQWQRNLGPKSKVSVDHEGPCEDDNCKDCKWIPGPEYNKPVCGDDGKTYKNKCELACLNQKGTSTYAITISH